MNDITLEGNVVKKDHRKVRLKFALAYPGPYSAGMSNLAIRLLYELINNREDCLCERFFFSEFRSPPLSLESNLPLGSFDVIGFTLQHELDYVRMLDMLVSSSIEPVASRRKRPLVIAGGPAASSNPSPVEDFVDLFVVGEAEPVLEFLLDHIAAGRDPSQLRGAKAGLYASGIEVERSQVASLDDAPHAIGQIHPIGGKGFSSTFLLEVSRGCSRGCRFCLECYIFGPRRERTLKKLKDIVEEGLSLTGLKKVACISSAFFDHREIRELLGWLHDRGIGYSLPSVRISGAGTKIAELLAIGGQRTITVAPETPSVALREVINKRFDDSELVDMLGAARKAGMSAVKLYFLVGIPGERMADLEPLRLMLSGILSTGFKPGSLHISVNPLVPKSNTPFQWTRLLGEAEYKSKLARITSICSEMGVHRVETMDYRWGAIQAYLSTSGRDASSVLLRVVEDIAHGGSGDLGTWRRVLRILEKDFETIQTSWSVGDELPWERIKGGPSKSILIREYEKATGGFAVADL